MTWGLGFVSLPVGNHQRWWVLVIGPIHLTIRFNHYGC